MKLNKIIITYIILWIISIIGFLKTKDPKWLFIVFIFTFINEIGVLIMNRDFLTASERTEIFYDISVIPTRKDTDQNYSEGYYPNNDFSITPRQAENNKFDKILELLGAKEGDTLLDLGCGVCSFEKYCHQKHINMIGLTLSSEQVVYCQEQGCEAVLWDYTKLNEKFQGKIDHIVILGSSEHVHTGSMHVQSSFLKKKHVMADLLNICKQYFKRDGKKHRIFYSGLHINPDTIGSFGWHIMERTYGGTLQCNTPQLDIRSSAQEAGLTTIFSRDATMDYYMATVLDENHFGNPIEVHGNVSKTLFALSFLYPPLFYHWIYYVFGYWMWMFDGKIHTDRSNFSLGSIEERPATLWWCLFE